MSLRTAFARRTAQDAVRRMNAVVGVLDQDLAEIAAQLAGPIPTRTLSESEWQAAEAARAAVEQDLRTLRAEASVLATQLADWRAREALASQRGDSLLAEQAHTRAADTEQLFQSYAEEIGAVRSSLLEWAVRVGRADSDSLPKT